MELTKIQKAIKFATKTHEVYQKQKRKGKDVAYIVHPLAVGILLSQAGASENIVIAGILHDTMEDSIDNKKVTAKMLTERFGKNVSDLVMSVTEQDKSLSWEERKKQAIEHIKYFSEDSLLLKSADVISNGLELLEDYKQIGDKVFENFNAPKKLIIMNYSLVIKIILSKWTKNPLQQDLNSLFDKLQNINTKNVIPSDVFKKAMFEETRTFYTAEELEERSKS